MSKTSAEVRQLLQDDNMEVVDLRFAEPAAELIEEVLSRPKEVF